MSNWEQVGTNALESFNSINNIENPVKRKEAMRKTRENMSKLTHILQKQILIKPKFIDTKVTD